MSFASSKSKSTMRQSIENHSVGRSARVPGGREAGRLSQLGTRSKLNTPSQASAKDSDWRRFACLLAAICALLLLHTSSLGTLAIAIAFVVLSLTGPIGALWALCGTWLIAVSHSEIFAHPAALSMLRYAVFFAALSGALISKNGLGGRGKHLLGSTIALFLAVILHSIAFSYNATLSVFKITSWVTVLLALWWAWGRISESQAVQFRKDLFYSLVILLIIALPLYFTDLGYSVNGRGFQGLLNHPQAWGLLTGVILTWAVGTLLQAQSNIWTLLGIAILAAISVSESGARTAMLGVALALVLASIISIWKTLRGAHSGLNTRFVVSALLLVLLGVGAVSQPQVQDFFATFLTKGGRVEASTFSEIYTSSRGVLYRPMFANIETNLWTGIGFGLASAPKLMVIQYDPLFGLPIGASVEKGNIYLAVLEELGLICALFVGGLVIDWVRRGFRSGFLGCALISYVLASNFAEATFFSMGGMGLILMIVFTCFVAHPRASR